MCPKAGHKLNPAPELRESVCPYTALVTSRATLPLSIPVSMVLALRKRAISAL